MGLTGLIANSKSDSELRYILYITKIYILECTGTWFYSTKPGPWTVFFFWSLGSFELLGNHGINVGMLMGWTAHARPEAAHIGLDFYSPWTR